MVLSIYDEYFENDKHLIAMLYRVSFKLVSFSRNFIILFTAFDVPFALIPGAVHFISVVVDLLKTEPKNISKF